MSLVGQNKGATTRSIYNSRNYMSLVGEGSVDFFVPIYNSRNYMSLVGSVAYVISILHIYNSRNYMSLVGENLKNENAISTIVEII